MSTHASKKQNTPTAPPEAPGTRDEIRETTRRVMGSRQSMRKVERSGQRRQPKRGRGSQQAPEN